MATNEFDPSHPLNVFGQELRRIRADQGLTLDQMAERVPFSASLIGAVERGQRRPTHEFVERIEEEFVLSGELLRLLPLIHKAASPTWFRPWTKVEESAITLRTWQPSLVPGLLQTESYARAVFTAEPGAIPNEVEQSIEARLQRQAIFQRPRPPIFSAVLDEAVLIRPVGGWSTMREQLGHLLKMITEFRIVIQIVPLELGLPVGLLGGFSIAQSSGNGDSVYFESAAHGYVSDRADEVRAANVRYDTIRAWAHPLHVSEELIRKTLESKHEHA
ncbi:helix-turn-helix domain-containing protein [Nonomuraea endophytica]|uniref:helix-turn-helix domain-containing protein n=1 Tax=Nonomuraea endophytica TaxID=714136 RepID=UPI0037CA8CF3